MALNTVKDEWKKSSNTSLKQSYVDPEVGVSTYPQVPEPPTSKELSILSDNAAPEPLLAAIHTEGSTMVSAAEKIHCQLNAVCDVEMTQTQLIPEKIDTTDQEFSLAKREDTITSLSGRQLSAASSSTTLQSRAGLLSQISILPGVFNAPAAEFSSDPVSSISLLHLSFLYKHAPSLRCIALEVSSESANIDDDYLQDQVEEVIGNQMFLFPKNCIANNNRVLLASDDDDDDVDITDDEDIVKGATVQLISQIKPDVKWSNLANGNVLLVSRRGSMNHTDSRSTKVGASLPLVTPRNILLLPEHSSSEQNLNDQQAAGKILQPPPRTLQAPYNPPLQKPQIMVCLKAASNLTLAHGMKNTEVVDGYKAAMVTDVFRELTDQRGLDFVRLRNNPELVSLLLHAFSEDEDICVMMESTRWPLNAQHWFSRERSNWPLREVIGKLEKVPCHVTPFTMKDAEGSKYIRKTFYSFPLVDNILFGSLTDKQCSVFVAVSVLYQKHFSEPPLLDLAHIKAVFFWACERAPADYWVTSDVATCTFHILNELINALNVSTLPHYITEENMLSHTSTETLKQVAEMVWLVRKNPIESLINLNHFGPYDKAICQPILNYIQGALQMEDAVSCIVFTALNISQSYVSEHSKAIAVHVLDDACSIVLQQRHFDKAAIALIQVTSNLYYDLRDLDKVIEYAENTAYIAYEYENGYLDLSTSLSRLATLYHCKAQDLATKGIAQLDCTLSNQQVWLQKAQRYFDLSLLEDYSLSTVVCFAVYLLNQLRPAEALQQLTDAIALTDDTEETALLKDTTTFTLLEVNTLDTDLAREVRAMGLVEAPTVVMGYYFLCKAALASKMVKRFAEYLIALQVLARSPANAHCHSTWALLGYIRVASKDMCGARSAFQEALFCKKDYHVIRDRTITTRVVPGTKTGHATSVCCVIL